MVYIQLTVFHTVRDLVYMVTNIYEEVKYKVAASFFLHIRCKCWALKVKN